MILTQGALPISAQVVFEPPYQESVTFPDCSSLKACDLKEFSYLYQDYKITFSDQKVSYGTRMFAKYQTENLATLENYGIVQFIKGCQFYSRVSQGGTEYIYNIVRDHFDERIPFVHKNWQVDSVDKDIMYNNSPAEFKEQWKTRHGLYRWNRVANSYDQKTEVLYYKEKPIEPSLYILDRPGTAFYENGNAKNISLQFKTCLYRTHEVPEVGHGDDLNFSAPLHCFNWSSSFVFDHGRKVFIKSHSIHPACL